MGATRRHVATRTAERDQYAGRACRSWGSAAAFAEPVARFRQAQPTDGVLPAGTSRHEPRNATNTPVELVETPLDDLGVLPRHPQTRSPGFDKLNQRMGYCPRARRDPNRGTRPIRRSSLSRPRESIVGLCRGILRPSRQVSTSSTNGRGTARGHVATRTAERDQHAGRACRDPARRSWGSAAASADPVARFRQAQPTDGVLPAGTSRPEPRNATNTPVEPVETPRDDLGTLPRHPQNRSPGFDKLNQRMGYCPRARRDPNRGTRPIRRSSLSRPR